jgi:hypothetical protein
MKRTILAAMASVLVTMAVMQANADPGATQLSASRVLGTDLHLTRCQAHPDNRVEWRRFSACASSNMREIQAWGHRLDACMTVYRFQARNDDAYTTADPKKFEQAPGLAPAGAGGNLMLVWRRTASCT